VALAALHFATSLEVEVRVPLMEEGEVEEEVKLVVEHLRNGENIYNFIIKL